MKIDTADGRGRAMSITIETVCRVTGGIYKGDIVTVVNPEPVKGFYYVALEDGCLGSIHSDNLDPIVSSHSSCGKK